MLKASLIVENRTERLISDVNPQTVSVSVGAFKKNIRLALTEIKCLRTAKASRCAT